MQPFMGTRFLQVFQYYLTNLETQSLSLSFQFKPYVTGNYYLPNGNHSISSCADHSVIQFSVHPGHLYDFRLLRLKFKTQFLGSQASLNAFHLTLICQFFRAASPSHPLTSSNVAIIPITPQKMLFIKGTILMDVMVIFCTLLT